MARSFAENVNGNLVTREDLLAFREDRLEKIGDVEGRIGGLEGRVIVLYWMAGVTLAGVVALWGITVAIIVALHISHSV